MDEVGIYRVSGGTLAISTLKDVFNSSKAANSALALHAWLSRHTYLS